MSEIVMKEQYNELDEELTSPIPLQNPNSYNWKMKLKLKFELSHLDKLEKMKKN